MRSCPVNVPPITQCITARFSPLVANVQHVILSLKSVQTEKASARSNSKLKTQGENLKNFDFDAFNGSPVIKIDI